MKTEVVKITDPHWDEKVKHLGEIIRNGGLVASLRNGNRIRSWGNGLDPEAAKDIRGKAALSDNPLILHVFITRRGKPPGGRYHATGEEADGCVLRDR